MFRNRGGGVRTDHVGLPYYLRKFSFCDMYNTGNLKVMKDKFYFVSLCPDDDEIASDRREGCESSDTRSEWFSSPTTRKQLTTLVTRRCRVTPGGGGDNVKLILFSTIKLSKQIKIITP